MEKEARELLNELLHHLNELDYVHPDDIPNIDLYMDQVLTFLEQQLGQIRRDDDDKAMTKTMINNYTKNQILPAPEKKKYSREHMLNLIFIYYLKNFLSMKDIKAILDPINEKYFNVEEGLNFYDIYNEIVTMEKSASTDLVKDVIRKYNSSRASFSEVAEDDKEDLQNFAFICLLSFDVFVKKMMIEQFIDGLTDKSEENSENPSEDAKTNVEAEPK